MAVYLCVAENKVGTVEKLFSLTVQGRPIYLTAEMVVRLNASYSWSLFLSLLVPPKIMGRKEEELSVIEGHMVSLLCDVQSYPPPEITWTRDGQVLNFDTGLHILPGQTWRTPASATSSQIGTSICLNPIRV